MVTLIKYLEKLGLSEVETKLYLALLKNGPKKVKDVASSIGLKRTTAYFHIDTLINKGLVAEVVKGSSKMITATPPERLKYLVEKKYDTAETLKNSLPDILTKIKAFQPIDEKSDEPEITFYKGIKSARAIYEEALTKNELRSYIRIDKEESLFPNNPIVFTNAFKKNKNLKIYEIIYDPDNSKVPSSETRSNVGRYFYKYMHKSSSFSSEDILLYDGKVAVLNFRGNKTSIVLKSNDLYNNFKDIFELLWSVLPDPS